jgi:hypothetical protein
MKKSTILSAAAAFALFSVFIGAAALSIDYGPGPITIDDTTKATNRYLGVSFSHSTHVAEVGLSCVMCHHTEKKDFVSGTPARCEACHKADAEITFKDAIHRRCVLCHINKVKEEDIGEGGKTEEGDRETPPTQCLQCHQQRR